MGIIRSLFVHLWCMFFYSFSSSYVRLWDADHKESWALKNWFFQTVVPEKTLESPFDYMEIKPVNSKGHQPWIFIGRADAETPILWPPDVKEGTHWKRPWCWERLKAKGEGGSSRWMRWLNSITDSVDMNMSKLCESEGQGTLGVQLSIGLQRAGHNLSTE